MEGTFETKIKDFQSYHIVPFSLSSVIITEMNATVDQINANVGTYNNLCFFFIRVWFVVALHSSSVVTLNN